jgi:hypothetical protein
MPSADDYRAQVTAARTALRDAISGAGSRWETAPSGGEGEDAWSPRQVAEHAIGSERYFAGKVAGSMEGKAPERIEFSFASNADALAALDSSVADCDKVFRYVEDRDLAKAAPMPDGAPFPKSIEGFLQLNAYHLNDHAKQIG